MTFDILDELGFGRRKKIQHLLSRIVQFTVPPERIDPHTSWGRQLLVKVGLWLPFYQQCYECHRAMIVPCIHLPITLRDILEFPWAHLYFKVRVKRQIILDKKWRNVIDKDTQPDRIRVTCCLKWMDV